LKNGIAGIPQSQWDETFRSGLSGFAAQVVWCYTIQFVTVLLMPTTLAEKPAHFCSIFGSHLFTEKGSELYART